MTKLTETEAQVLTELDGAPDKTLREATLRSCAPHIGIMPRRLPLVMSRLMKLGFVEKSEYRGETTPRRFNLTPTGEAALKAWQDDVPEMTVF